MAGCLCDVCVEADRKYKAEWYALQRAALRKAPAVLVTELTPHLDALLDAGMTRKQIAQQAGVSYDIVMHVLAGNRVRVRAATASALRSVKLPTSRVTADGLTRRVQALAYMGWTTKALTERSSGVLTRIDLARIIKGAGWMPKPAQVAAVLSLTKDLWNKRGDCERTRLYARQMGWCSYLAWDEHDIDRRRGVAQAPSVRAG